MLQLFLLRHAKSDWTAGAKDDHSRPLNSRGIKAALRVGSFMQENKLLPDRILCSTAKRTRQTAELLTETWPGKYPITVSRKLYLAGAESFVEVIRKRGGANKRLLVIGHNPDITDVALAALRKGRKKARQEIGKFPTGSLACLTFPSDAWRDIEPGTATFVAFITPKQIV
ncbi:MAG: histidine phosphatase family protein [Pseudomonadota bacterium]